MLTYFGLLMIAFVLIFIYGLFEIWYFNIKIRWWLMGLYYVALIGWSIKTIWGYS